MDAILKTYQLTKRYGKRNVVNGVNITVNSGEIYGFLGPNGAGKTTTLRMILGLIRPTSGRIELLGQNPTNSPRSFMRHIGYMIEGPGFYPHLSAQENLRIVLRFKELTNDQSIPELLDLVGLGNVGSKAAGCFSLGMKQRLGIAMALLGEPKILILDEPSNGLDPEGFREIRALLKYLAKEKNTTILLSSHLLHEVEQICQRVGVIHNGHILTESTVDELRQKGERCLELDVSNPDLAMALLNKHTEAQVELQSDGFLLIKGKGRADAPAINSLLVQSDVSVFSLTQKETSLEQIFIEMTGGEIANA